MSRKPKITYHREDNGWAYSIQSAGKVLAEGWSRGSKKDARDDAEAVLQRYNEASEPTPGEGR